MSEEFGPWITHDGAGRPVAPGTIVMVEVECITGLVKQTVQPAGSAPVSAWVWSAFGASSVWRVLRYRIKKPRGLTILEEVANSVREPVDA